MEVTGEVVLICGPNVVPAITLTEKVHEPPAGSVMAGRLIVPGAVVFTVPQVPFGRPLGVASITPNGSVSLKLTPVSGTMFAGGLMRVNVKVEFPF